MKILPDSLEEIFVALIFMEKMCGAMATPLRVDGHAPHGNQRNNTEQQNKEASLCNNGLVFLLCVSVRPAAVGEKLAC